MIPEVYAALGTEEPAQLVDLEKIFENVIQAAIPLGGIILFIVLMYGGFQFITSGGDAKKAGAAKQTLTYAIIGMVLLASAFLILRIIASFSGVTSILNFDIFQE